MLLALRLHSSLIARHSAQNEGFLFMANKGFFIITDISGYTEYLTELELDHAHEILQSLFDAQLKHINFPLKISGFCGDAIFMFTPELCFVNPQTFLETLENLYIV